MSRRSLPYRVYLWDFDGTLFDSYPTMNRAMSQALLELGMPRPEEEVRRLMKQSVSTALCYYQEHFSMDAGLEKLFRKKEKELSADLPPYPGMKDLCRRIYEKGGMNLLYTHRDTFAEELLKRHGFSRYFSGGVTAEDHFPSKPAPDAIIFLMKQFSFMTEEALMIGDRDIDLLAAKNAGVDGYLFDPMDDYASFQTPFRGHSVFDLESFLL